MGEWPPVAGLEALLALNREQLTIGALAALSVAGVVVSAGAWILLFRERRTRRPPDGG